MRAIFITLIAVNAIFFSYVWYLQEIAPVKSSEIKEVPVRKGARLVLLSERPGVREGDFDVAAPLGGEVEQDINEAQPVRGLVCTAVGPFNASITASNLKQRLLAIGVASNIQTVSIPKNPDYWVYLQPRTDRAEALREVRRLHKEAIDSYVIGDGDMRNGVSLGLFSQEGSALDTKARVAELGYVAEVKTVERFEEQYWLALVGYESGEIDEEVWSQLESYFGFAERQDRLCAPEKEIVVPYRLDLE